jgi:hypothetical protein
MEFGLLGPLMVRAGTLAVPVPRGKQRAVLAALLLRANRVVSLDELAETLWGGNPPPSARVAVQDHVMRLRKIRTSAGLPLVAALAWCAGILAVSGAISMLLFNRRTAWSRLVTSRLFGHFVTVSYVKCKYLVLFPVISGVLLINICSASRLSLAAGACVNQLAGRQQHGGIRTRGRGRQAEDTRSRRTAGIIVRI